ncbi:MAG: glucosamine-6-phosphate deaminase [Opitutaceae bacterium]|nr:glucosamine-6-phosphate deaminase [Opitutaceae bacterium]
MSVSSTSSRFLADRLKVEVHPNRAALGLAAARAAASHLAEVITRQGHARVIFGCAPSQNEFLAGLRDPVATGVAIPWDKVTAFHMDEYIGMPPHSAQSFRRYLKEHLLDWVHVGQFHALAGEATDIPAECARYGALLAAAPIDLICLGIGENGHLAFNDPPVADFDDPVLVRTVELEEVCRRQQVFDGWYSSIDSVPRHALSLTIPVFRNARRLSIHVPGPRKAAAVRATVQDPVTTACPATILRSHPDATLYIDRHSAADLFNSTPSTRSQAGES